ncbi:uncharacterized protein BJ171DRAFT_582250 [Polychytrium aggregatum]|uniref:uncharacterized protein n=1 Tax=Polychytrium aggregatum TaxID=110093 RepID=UPI0022FDB180|nr:uncharacterized protein BJ171DRAFT_582250 [Polychytrium aggregatum]KAI9204274.1 hypothetical protein BJ171DRAFT_582250 [Polychytrium aggregatum]
MSSSTPDLKNCFILNNATLPDGYCTDFDGYYVHADIVSNITQTNIMNLSLPSPEAQMVAAISMMEDPNGPYWTGSNSAMFLAFQNVCQNPSASYDATKFASRIRYFRDHVCHTIVRRSSAASYCGPSPNKTLDSCNKVATFALRDSFPRSARYVDASCRNITLTGRQSPVDGIPGIGDIFTIGSDKTLCQGNPNNTALYNDSCGFMQYVQTATYYVPSLVRSVVVFDVPDVAASHDLCNPDYNSASAIYGAGSDSTQTRGWCCTPYTNAIQAAKQNATSAQIKSFQTTQIIIGVSVSIAIIMIGVMVTLLYRRYRHSRSKLTQVEKQKTTVEQHLVETINKPAPTAFSKKWVVDKPYTAVRGDEIDLSVGDMVVLLSIFNDGWGHGHNETTDCVGTLPLSALRTIDSPAISGYTSQHSPTEISGRTSITTSSPPPTL